MTEVGPATPRRTRTGHSYANQWNRFVAWAQASGRGSLPASPEDVAAYLEDISETGARPSTLRVVAAAIAILSERRAFIESFVKEIIVMPGDALMRYTVPIPDDSLIPGRATEKVALNGSVLSTVHDGGPECTVLRTFRWEVLIWEVLI